MESMRFDGRVLLMIEEASREQSLADCINANISMIAISAECWRITEWSLTQIGQSVVDALLHGLASLSTVPSPERPTDLEQRPVYAFERPRRWTGPHLQEVLDIHCLAGKCLHGREWLLAEQPWRDLAKHSLAGLLKRISQSRPDLSLPSELLS
jgi:hypothetical protein